MSDARIDGLFSKLPAWWGVIAAVGLMIATAAHVESATGDNSRQISLLWARANDNQKVAADISAIKAHAEDTEKRIDQIDAKMDRVLDRGPAPK